MMAWVFAATVAFAAAPPAVLLSRFPAGEVPPSDEVLEAIAELSTSGSTADLPLLRSLTEHESGEVQAAAFVVLEHAMVEQARADQADAQALFRASLPTSRERTRWLSEARQAEPGSPLHALNRPEQEAIAYAALLLGTHWDSPVRQLSVPDKDEARALLDQALDLEASLEVPASVQPYARAAAGGSPEATAALQRLGVDVDLLLVGLTTTVPVGGLPRLRPEQVGSIVKVGTTHSVDVLIERARRQTGIERLVALDNLGALIRSGALGPVQRRVVRGVLEQATHDPRVEVRQLARASLSTDPDLWP